MHKIVGVTFAVMTILSACAQDEEPTIAASPTVAASPSPGTSPAATAQTKISDHGTKTFTTQTFSVEIELDDDGDDYYFSPTFIKSPGDSTANIELKNEGAIPHTFTSDVLNFDAEVAPNATKKLTVKVGAETRYEFYCKFHKDLGMSGAFQPH